MEVELDFNDLTGVVCFDSTLVLLKENVKMVHKPPDDFFFKFVIVLCSASFFSLLFLLDTP